MSQQVSYSAFDSVPSAFAVAGLEMRSHKGRSVVQVNLEGRVHYLKRYWLAGSQIFQRHVARGHHELRMIDWLNQHGFAGPSVVRRGASRCLGVYTKLYFLMEEIKDELPLESAWRKNPPGATQLLQELASFSAKLHESGFVHTDFSERHILVGGPAGNRTFRLIDVERANIGKASPRRIANDLATLVASIADHRLQSLVREDFLDIYIAQRSTLESGDEFRRLFKQARPTKSF